MQPARPAARQSSHRALTRPLLGPEDAAVLQKILAEESWDVVYDEQAITVLHRRS